MALRQKALSMAKKSTEKSFKLPYTTTVAKVYLGVPNFTIETVDGEATAKEFELTDVALEQIIDYGYVEGGKLILKNNSDRVRLTFVDKLMKVDGTPVIVFKKGGYLVAFPANLRKTSAQIGEKIYDIVNNSNNPVKVATEINRLLSDYGLDKKKYKIQYANADNNTLYKSDGDFTDNVKQAIADLNLIKDYPDVASWDKNHDKNSLKDEISLHLDLEKQTLSSPKVVIRFDDMIEITDDVYTRFQQEGEKTLTEEEVVDFANKGISAEEEARNNAAKKEGFESYEQAINELESLEEQAKEDVVKYTLELIDKKNDKNVYTQIEGELYLTDKGQAYIVKVGKGILNTPGGEYIIFYGDDKVYKRFKLNEAKKFNGSITANEYIANIRKIENALVGTGALEVITEEAFSQGTAALNLQLAEDRLTVLRNRLKALEETPVNQAEIEAKKAYQEELLSYNNLENVLKSNIVKLIGEEINVNIKQNTRGLKVFIKNKDGNNIFTVTFQKINNNTYEPGVLHTNEKYRRKGIASKVYEISNNYLNINEKSTIKTKDSNFVTIVDGVNVKSAGRMWDSMVNKGIAKKEGGSYEMTNSVDTKYDAEIKALEQSTPNANQAEIDAIKAEIAKAEAEQATDALEEDEFDKLLSGEAEARRKQGKYTKDGITYVRQKPNKNRPTGNTANTQFAEGLDVAFEYELIESEELQPSHTGVSRNRLFFITEAQPKNRTDSGSVAQYTSIAKKPDFQKLGESPNAYSGAPVINERGEVIQGNNRSQGIKMHYSENGVTYKKALEKEAAKFGFTAEQVQGMKNPVLVRRVTASDEKAIELGNYDVKDIETGNKSRLNVTNVSRRIPKKVKGLLTEALFGGVEFTTVNKALRANFETVVGLVKKYLNPSQIGGLYDKSREPSPEGLEDLEKLVNSFLFDDSIADFEEQFGDMSSRIKNGIFKSSPKILTLSSNKSIKGELQNAINLIYNFQKSKAEDFGTFLNQVTIFSDGTSVRDSYTEFDITLAQFLLTAKTETAIVNMFSKYNLLVEGAGADLLSGGTDAVSKLEGFRDVFDEKKLPQNIRASQKTAKKADIRNIVNNLNDAKAAIERAKEQKQRVEEESTNLPLSTEDYTIVNTKKVQKKIKELKKMPPNKKAEANDEINKKCFD